MAISRNGKELEHGSCTIRKPMPWALSPYIMGSKTQKFCHQFLVTFGVKSAFFVYPFSLLMFCGTGEWWNRSDGLKRHLMGSTNFPLLGFGRGDPQGSGKNSTLYGQMGHYERIYMPKSNFRNETRYEDGSFTTGKSTLQGCSDYISGSFGRFSIFCQKMRNAQNQLSSPARLILNDES